MKTLSVSSVGLLFYCIVYINIREGEGERERCMQPQFVKTLLSLKRLSNCILVVVKRLSYCILAIPDVVAAVGAECIFLVHTHTHTHTHRELWRGVLGLSFSAAAAAAPSEVVAVVAVVVAVVVVVVVVVAVFIIFFRIYWRNILASISSMRCSR